MRISGWGRYPQADCHVVAPRDIAALSEALRTTPGLIARGNGRAYGDAAMGSNLTLDMRGFDRMLAFDDSTGELVAESAVLLADVIAAFLPRGWFPMITPGTRFVTLGGMAAADVHGKNHHGHGAFRSCVNWLDLMRPDGTILRVSPEATPELFDRTLGGMGLTGIILRLAIRLIPVETGWVRQETIDAPDLAAAMASFEAHQNATYSVAWIDCLARGRALGRSLMMFGEHARRDELPPNLRRRPLMLPAKRHKAIPVDFPALALNRFSVRAFNALYYRKGRRGGPSLITWESYFYPLDAVLHWNRIYGRRGFVQFQCALPLASSEAGLTALLQQISASGQGSFLAVLKRFGAQQSALSFPMEGYTLALDFPARPACLALLRDLAPVVADHGGRFYLAKDALLDAEMLDRCDPRTAAFRAARQAEGEAAAFRSLQSDRLSL